MWDEFRPVRRSLLYWLLPSFRSMWVSLRRSFVSGAVGSACRVSLLSVQPARAVQCSTTVLLGLCSTVRPVRPRLNRSKEKAENLPTRAVDQTILIPRQDTKKKDERRHNQLGYTAVPNTNHQLDGQFHFFPFTCQFCLRSV